MMTAIEALILTNAKPNPSIDAAAWLIEAAAAVVQSIESVVRGPVKIRAVHIGLPAPHEKPEELVAQLVLRLTNLGYTATSTLRESTIDLRVSWA